MLDDLRTALAGQVEDPVGGFGGEQVDAPQGAGKGAFGFKKDGGVVLLLEQILRFGDDRGVKKVRQAVQKDSHRHGAAGLQGTGGVVDTVAQLGNGGVKADAVLLFDGDAVDVFGYSGNGNAAAGGNVFDSRHEAGSFRKNSFSLL